MTMPRFRSRPTADHKLEYEHVDDWRFDGACSTYGVKDGDDPWFSPHADDKRRAARICRMCPVKDRCFAAALARREPWGVWGGMEWVNGKPQRIREATTAERLDSPSMRALIARAEEELRRIRETNPEPDEVKARRLLVLQGI